MYVVDLFQNHTRNIKSQEVQGGGGYKTPQLMESEKNSSTLKVLKIVVGKIVSNGHGTALVTADLSIYHLKH